MSETVFTNDMLSEALKYFSTDELKKEIHNRKVQSLKNFEQITEGWLEMLNNRGDKETDRLLTVAEHLVHGGLGKGEPDLSIDQQNNALQNSASQNSVPQESVPQGSASQESVSQKAVFELPCGFAKNMADYSREISANRLLKPVTQAELGVLEFETISVNMLQPGRCLARSGVKVRLKNDNRDTFGTAAVYTFKFLVTQEGANCKPNDLFPRIQEKIFKHVKTLIKPFTNGKPIVFTNELVRHSRNGFLIGCTTEPVYYYNYKIMEDTHEIANLPKDRLITIE